MSVFKIIREFSWDKFNSLSVVVISIILLDLKVAVWGIFRIFQILLTQLCWIRKIKKKKNSSLFSKFNEEVSATLEVPAHYSQKPLLIFVPTKMCMNTCRSWWKLHSPCSENAYNRKVHSLQKQHFKWLNWELTFNSINITSLFLTSFPWQLCQPCVWVNDKEMISNYNRNSNAKSSQPIISLIMQVAA